MNRAQEILQTPAAELNCAESACAVANSEGAGLAYAFSDRSFLYFDERGECCEWTVEQFLSLARREHPAATSTAELAVAWSVDPDCDPTLAGYAVCVDEFTDAEELHSWFLFADGSSLVVNTEATPWARTSAEYDESRAIWQAS